MQFAIRPPHFTAITNHGRHGSIHDHIIRRVQVGNAFVRIDHRQPWALGFTRLNRGFNGFLLLGWQGLNFFIHAAHAIIGLNPNLLKQVAVLRKQVFVEHLNRMTEYNRVRYFHHGGFNVQ